MHSLLRDGHIPSVISSLILTNDAAKRVEGGQLWFSGRDVIGRRPKIAGIARLLDRRRSFLGQAFCSPGSRYFLRLITREDVPIDRAFWRERIRCAYARRRSLEAITDAFRVVHAEADGIPGVVIDRYSDVWAIQATSAGAEAVKQELIEIILQEYHPAALIEKNASPMRKAEGLSTDDRIAIGTKTTALVREGKERFEVEVLSGQKTGAYLDYRSIRMKARELARGRCLDAFCYQGWFACQIAGLSEAVVAIDSSAAAIDAARRNAEINRHANIECVRADAFDFLASCGAPFDFIHLDPPSFAKGRAGLAAALAGYRRLLASALKLIARDGILMVSACSHAITGRVLEEVTLGSVAKAGRRGEIISRNRQDIDHPLLAGHPESLYLQSMAVQMG